MLHKKRKHYQRITELYNLTQRYVPDYVRLFEYVVLENKGHNIVRFACEISDVDYSCAGNNEMEGLIKIVELSRPDIFKEIQTINNPMRKVGKISELMGWSFEDDSGLDKETSDLIFDFESMVDMFWFSGDMYNKLIAVNVSFKRDGFITTRLLKLRNQISFMMTFCLQVMVVVSLIEEHERANKMRKKF